MGALYFANAERTTALAWSFYEALLYKYADGFVRGRVDAPARRRGVRGAARARLPCVLCLFEFYVGLSLLYDCVCCLLVFVFCLWLRLAGG